MEKSGVLSFLKKEELQFLRKLAVELKKEELKFLKDLSIEFEKEEISPPLIFKIMDIKTVIGLDINYNDNICVVNSDGSIFKDESEFIEYIKDEYFKGNKCIKDLEKIKTTDIKDFQLLVDLLCELGDNNWIVTGYLEEYEYKGEFLTRESAEAHLKTNKHQYSDDATIHVSHSLANPVLRDLLEIVKKFDNLI